MRDTYRSCVNDVATASPCLNTLIPSIPILLPFRLKKYLVILIMLILAVNSLLLSSHLQK